MLFKNLNIHNFWQNKSLFHYLLIPFSLLWVLGSFVRKVKKTYNSNLFIICLGNLNLGGSGKTPTAIFLGRQLSQLGFKVAFLSKGYGGCIKEVVWVNNKHTPQQVGDEPILLSQHLPTIISKNMIKGLKFLEKEGFKIVITDDGFQNPSFKKDFNIVVVNGNYGFGNGLVFPSGPLREKIDSGLKRANSVIVLEFLSESIKKILGYYNLNIITGEYVPSNNSLNLEKYKKVIAFCGIGIPEKFKKTLEKYKIIVEDFIIFKDHHYYSNKDLDYLIEKSLKKNLPLVTTEKDFVKIPLQYRSNILSFNINLKLNNYELLLNKIIEKYEEKQKKVKKNI